MTTNFVLVGPGNVSGQVIPGKVSMNMPHSFQTAIEVYSYSSLVKILLFLVMINLQIIDVLE